MQTERPIRVLVAKVGLDGHDRGAKVIATALRDAVIKGDREAFSKAAGVDANTDVAGTPYFDLVAHYLLPYQNAPKKSAAKKKVKEPAKQDVEEEAAGVGIITKQNSTADVNKNTPRKNLKAFKLI